MSMTQVARIVKPGFTRPAKTVQIIRAMQRAKKPYQGAVVRLTEAGMAASEPVTLPAVGSDCPDCGSGIAAMGQSLCSECASAAARKSDESLTWHEAIAEVERRYGDPQPDGDHLVFRGNAAGDFVHVSVPVEEETEFYCWRGSQVSLPAVAFGAAAARWAEKQKTGGRTAASTHPALLEMRGAGRDDAPGRLSVLAVPPKMVEGRNNPDGASGEPAG